MYCLADWVMVIWGIYPNDAIEATGFKDDLGQFTRNYTQTTKRGLLTTNKG